MLELLQASSGISSEALEGLAQTSPEARKAVQLLASIRWALPPPLRHERDRELAGAEVE